MEECKLTVKLYTGEEIPVMGQLYVDVRYQKNEFVNLRMVILKGHGVNILGREWLNKIKLNLNNVMTCSSVINEVNKLLDRKVILPKLNGLLVKYSGLFSEKLGKVNGFKARLNFKENATPKFMKA